MSATPGSEGEALALFSHFLPLFLSLLFVSAPIHFLSEMVLIYTDQQDSWWQQRLPVITIALSVRGQGIIIVSVIFPAGVPSVMFISVEDIYSPVTQEPLSLRMKDI